MATQRRLQPGYSPPLVVIVEDDPALRGMMARVLRYKGYKVTVTGTAERGKTLVQQEPLALLVVDLHLPDGDGWSVIAAMQGDAPKPPLPVIVASTECLPNDQVQSKAIAGFLKKPFLMDELVEMIGHVLQDPIRSAKERPRPEWTLWPGGSERSKRDV